MTVELYQIKVYVNHFSLIDYKPLRESEKHLEIDSKMSVTKEGYFFLNLIFNGFSYITMLGLIKNELMSLAEQMDILSPEELLKGLNISNVEGIIKTIKTDMEPDIKYSIKHFFELVFDGEMKGSMLVERKRAIKIAEKFLEFIKDSANIMFEYDEFNKTRGENEFVVNIWWIYEKEKSKTIKTRTVNFRRN